MVIQVYPMTLSYFFKLYCLVSPSQELHSLRCAHQKHYHFLHIFPLWCLCSYYSLCLVTGFIFAYQNWIHHARSIFNATICQEASPDFSNQCHLSRPWTSHSISFEHLLLNFVLQKVCTYIVSSVEFKLARGFIQNRPWSICERGKNTIPSLRYNLGHFSSVNISSIPHNTMGLLTELHINPAFSQRKDTLVLTSSCFSCPATSMFPSYPALEALL